jgi:MSHA biogenesis protein MshN
MDLERRIAIACRRYEYGMGIFPMSLINQMLQELDARQSDASGSGHFGSSVRTVPERRGVHPAWWVVLALALALGGVVTWLLLRPPVSEAAGSLPLKLEAEATKPTTIPELPPVAPAGIVPEAPLAFPPSAIVEPVAPSPPVIDSNVMVPEQSASPQLPSKEPRSAAAPAMPIAPAAALPESEAPIQVRKEVKEMSPQQLAENEFRRALMSLQQERSAEAIERLERSLKLDPRHVGARQTLIGLLLDSKRRDEAILAAREGLQLDVRLPGLAMIFARLQMESDTLDAAIETLQKTLPYAEDRADYHAFFAALLQRDQQHGKAADHYLLALRQEPQNGVWWMGLGISLQAEQRTADAKEAYTRAKEAGNLSAELLSFIERRLKQLQP